MSVDIASTSAYQVGVAAGSFGLPDWAAHLELADTFHPEIEGLLSSDQQILAFRTLFSGSPEITQEMLCWASKNGEPGAVKYLVERGVPIVSDPEQEAKPCYPVHVAAFAENMAVLEYLVGQDDVAVDMFDDHGYTPLMRAVEDSTDPYRESDAVKYLLDQGADPFLSQTGLHGGDEDVNAFAISLSLDSHYTPHMILAWADARNVDMSTKITPLAVSNAGMERRIPWGDEHMMRQILALTDLPTLETPGYHNSLPIELSKQQRRVLAQIFANHTDTIDDLPLLELLTYLASIDPSTNKPNFEPPLPLSTLTLDRLIMDSASGVRGGSGAAVDDFTSLYRFKTDHQDDLLPNPDPYDRIPDLLTQCFLSAAGSEHLPLMQAVLRLAVSPDASQDEQELQRRQLAQPTRHPRWWSISPPRLRTARLPYITSILEKVVSNAVLGAVGWAWPDDAVPAEEIGVRVVRVLEWLVAEEPLSSSSSSSSSSSPHVSSGQFGEIRRGGGEGEGGAGLGPYLDGHVAFGHFADGPNALWVAVEAGDKWDGGPEPARWLLRSGLGMVDFVEEGIVEKAFGSGDGGCSVEDDSRSGVGEDAGGQREG